MPSDNVRIITPEAEKVARSVRAWLNTYPYLPYPLVDYEFLGDDCGLSVITTQAAYKTHHYILGDYEAQYQFAIFYRSIHADANERLISDEFLNNMALWATENPLTLDSPCRTVKVQQNTNSAILARYENGAEDHTVNMTLIYEVIKNG